MIEIKTIAYNLAVKQIPAIVMAMMFASDAHGKDAPADRALLEWARSAPEVAGVAPAKPAKAAATVPVTQTQPEVKQLFVERNPEPTERSGRRGGIAGVAHPARAAVAAGSTVGRAFTGFFRAYKADDDGKPEYMRREDRTARYNNHYSLDANDEPYSPLQTGAKTIHEVDH